jgi:hypothetical protein
MEMVGRVLRRSGMIVCRTVQMGTVAVVSERRASSSVNGRLELIVAANAGSVQRAVASTPKVTRSRRMLAQFPHTTSAGAM